MVSIDSLAETTGDWIINRTKTVILIFVVLTIGLTAGLGGVSTDAGTDQFAEGIPAQDAFEDVNQEFETQAFTDDIGSTQIIQRSQNVLSKDSLLRVLTLQERVAEREGLRVEGTSSAATIIAQRIDPEATTLAAQQSAIESASEDDIDRIVEEAAQIPGFSSQLSTDFNAKSASASATIAGVQHSVPAGLSSTAGAGGTSPLTSIQQTVDHIAQNSRGDFNVFGTGIVSGELMSVIGDSMTIVIPASGLLILIFLAFAYRDPVDLLLGIIALVMTLLWTFGFMGLAGIPFSQMLIAVPVLLLAVGIDFGIHTINRYREERATGAGISEAMQPTTDQLLIAFVIVSGTTVLGFGSNVVSELGPIRDFGLVAAIGMIFTFLIFGIFLPAMKVYLDRVRDRFNIPRFSEAPIGSGSALLSKALASGNWFAKRAPKAFLSLLLISSVIAGVYGTGVDTSFSNEDFLPPEETPEYIESLPEPFAPGEYSVTRTLNYLEDTFESAQDSSVTIFIDAPLRQDDTLQQLHRATVDPPDSIIAEGRRAEPDSIVSVIQNHADSNPEFAELVARNDQNADGIPDDNLETVYDSLLESGARSQALNYISEDYRSTRVVYATKSSATQDEVAADGGELADQYRLPATATGQTIVFAAVTDVIFTSAIQSLIAALLATAVFLIFIYWLLENRPSLGIVNLIPIVMTVAFLAGSMRFLDIPLNALTATVLAIAIGLGIDYSAHFVHRFIDEYNQTGNVNQSLDDTVQGTGGALAGSMLTTTTGTGVLALAITPILGQFGLVIALSVFISFTASILVTPSVAVIWDQWVNTESA